MRRHRSRRKNKQRKIIIISMCSLLLIMTVGYAAMQTNLEIKAKGNVVKKTTAGSDLVDMAGIVNSGDGLYKDVYEENVYTYRGTSPNNYVIFNDELWRIISVNTSDNTIKIIRNEILEDRAFDTASGRYQGDNGYCNDDYYGCNIWGSISTLYDTNLSPITTLVREVEGTEYVLPNREATLNIYLNEDYYNSLNNEAQNMLIDGIYKSGPIRHNNEQSIYEEINYVNSAIWKGKIALIGVTEYVRASTDNNCKNIYTGSYYNSSYYCQNNNWMFNGDYWWTMTPYSNFISSLGWTIFRNGALIYETHSSSSSTGVRSVVTLSPEVQITSGDGSESSPFELTM